MMNVEDKQEAVRRFFLNIRPESRKPIYVGLEPLTICNADCGFCDYRRSDNGERKKRETDEILYGIGSYLSQLIELNPIFLSILGGEPLLREDLENIVSEAKHQAKIPWVSMTTNGSLLNWERYRSLSERGLNGINISLDYVGSGHDKSRGIRRLYQKIVSFLDEWEANGKNGAKIALNSILMDGSVQHTRQIAELANKYGIQMTLFPLNPRGYTSIEGAVVVPALRLNRERARIEVEKLFKDYSSVLINPECTRGPIGDFFGKAIVPNCDAGRSFMWIKPDGSYKGCLYIDDVRRTSLSEVHDFAEGNTCGDCYLPCRAMPEQLARADVIDLSRLFGHFDRLVSQ